MSSVGQGVFVNAVFLLVQNSDLNIAFGQEIHGFSYRALTDQFFIGLSEVVFQFANNEFSDFFIIFEQDVVLQDPLVDLRVYFDFEGRRNPFHELVVFLLVTQSSVGLDQEAVDLQLHFLRELHILHSRISHVHFLLKVGTLPVQTCHQDSHFSEEDCSDKGPNHEQGADEHSLYSVSRTNLPSNQHEYGVLEAE